MDAMDAPKDPPIDRPQTWSRRHGHGRRHAGGHGRWLLGASAIALLSWGVMEAPGRVALAIGGSVLVLDWLQRS